MYKTNGNLWSFLYSMSYWDILDFLAEEESITIKFSRDALGLEQLDRSKDFTDRVPAG